MGFSGDQCWEAGITTTGVSKAAQFTGKPKPAEFPVQLSGISHNSDDMSLLLQKVLMLC